LEKYSKRGRNKSIRELDLKNKIKELQKIFWYEVIQEVCNKTLFHIREAQKNLRNIATIKDKAIFESILGTVEKSAREALAEQKEMLEFLEEYE
jgi:hypothetical protein